MRILICGIMPPKTYSGGRYHAWLMAEAFADMGHDVTFWTNNEPIFLADFIDYPAHASVNLFISESFTHAPDGTWDYIWIIPHKNPPYTVFCRALEIAAENNAKIGLLNFETPNWIAETSPQPVDFGAWYAWKKVSPHADLILSSSREGMKYAKTFYGSSVETHHAYCNPAINDRAARAALTIASPPSDEKLVLCITRFGGANGYKGGRELLSHVGKELSNCRLVFIVGTGSIPENDYRDYLDWGKKNSIDVQFKYRVSDLEKFTLIREAALLIFLSRFEGFGYPPVEAAYCGTPCITYDLPVLKQVSGDALVYSSGNDPHQLRTHISDVLSDLPKYREKASRLDRTQVGFEAYKANLDNLLSRSTGQRSISEGAKGAEVKATIMDLQLRDKRLSPASNIKKVNKKSIRTRIARVAVTILSHIFSRNRLLLKIVAKAILDSRNLNSVLDDKDISSLLFVKTKPLSRQVRQNPLFLRHVMLSPEGKSLISEVITEAGLKDQICSDHHTLDEKSQ